MGRGTGAGRWGVYGAMVLGFLLVCPPTALGNYFTDMTRLNKALLQPEVGYDTDVQPTPPISVEMSMMLRSLSSMNIENQSMTLKYILAMVWTDERLSWNPEDYGNISSTMLSSERIWTPPIYIENSVKSEGLLTSNVPMMVEHSGIVHWYFETASETECQVSTKHYPFDKQVCDLRFLYWGSSETASLTLETDPIAFDWLAPNGEWDIREGSAEIKELVWSPSLVSPRIQFRITLQRRRTYYLTAIIVPVLLLSVLIVAVFWVPIESGEKIGYCLTILLTYTLFLSIVSDELPPIATDVSYLQLYLAVSMALGVVATLLTTLVLHLYHKGQAPVSGWLKGLTKHFLLPVTCLRTSTCCRKGGGESSEGPPEKYLPPVMGEEEASETEKEHPVSYQMVAVALDRFFLMLYTVLMLACTTIFTVFMTSH